MSGLGAMLSRAARRAARLAAASRLRLRGAARILVVRHRAHIADYNEPFLRWVERRSLAARARFDVRLLPCELPDPAGYALFVPWVQDPLRERFPAIHRLLRAYEDRCARAGVPVVNRVDSLSASVKSRASAALRAAGLRAPRAVRIEDRAAFRRDAGGLAPPFFVREDERHGGPMRLVRDEAELARLELDDLERPVAIEWIDVRSPDGLYRKWRWIGLGGAGVPRHMVAARGWVAHAEDRVLDARTIAEETAYTSGRDPNEEALQRARRALGLDVVAFDYAYDRDGRLVIFEPNPFPLLWAPFNDTPAYAYQHPARDRLFRAMLAYYFERAGIANPLDGVATTYEEIFEARGHLYNAATSRCPGARETERRRILDRLALEPGVRVCDAPAGGGYVAEGIDRALGGRARIACVEPALAFARGIDRRFPRVVGRLDRLPLASASVDRVASLAGLHHLPDKAAFVREAFRVLRPGGRIAVADVLEGTPPARFLNDAVDRLSTTGHRGIFLARGELETLLRDAGFVGIEERYETFPWTFPDDETLVAYVKELFGLVRADADTVRREVEAALAPRRGPTGAEIPWGLLYASGTKPAEA